MEEIKAYVIAKKELLPIERMDNFNANGCDVKVRGIRKPMRFEFHCTNTEVYLMSGYSGYLRKLSDDSTHLLTSDGLKSVAHTHH